jgi:hypothetical protein
MELEQREPKGPYCQVCWDVDLSACGAITLTVRSTIFVITAIDTASGDLEKIKFGNARWYVDVGVVACRRTSAESRSHINAAVPSHRRN